MNLTEFLANLSAEHDHAIPFERFMREALYHPDFGYYTANIQTVGGRHADFSTSATLLPDLAPAIASWIQDEITFHNRRPGAEGASACRSLPAEASREGRVTLLEIGAGDGSLLLHVLKHLRRRYRRTLNFHIVETSPKLETLQREKLAKFKNITWHRDMPSAIQAANSEVTLVYSNELVDAFPATALRWNTDASRWEEICLSFDPAHGLKEVFIPNQWQRGASPDAVGVVAEAFSALNGSYADGQRIELHRSYRDWLHSWIPSLQNASLLTIDYGETVENLYSRLTRGQPAVAENRVQRHAGGDTVENLYGQLTRGQPAAAENRVSRLVGTGRSQGTLRAYYKHQRFEGPPEIYARFGKQDLTADVNFTDIKNWGETLGLKTVSLQSQAEFIGDPSRASHPAHAAFKVLHQRAPNPPAAKNKSC